MSAISAFLAYLIPPIVAPLIMLFRRKDYFALYHACQALAIVVGFVVVVVGWAVIGWLLAFVSITIPEIYIVPIVWALVAPIWGMIKRSRRYQGRGIWGSMAVTLGLALVFSWLAWRVILWLAPNVLPLTGPFLQMASFALVIAAAAVLVVGLVLGMVNSARDLARKAPLYGALGERWFNWITRKARAHLEASDAAVAYAAELAALHETDSPAMMADIIADEAAEKATLADTPLTSSSIP